MFQDWLLCDFHIHTSFSDGELSLNQVVDLYGENGFDAISITDHVLDRKSIEERQKAGEKVEAIPEDAFMDYMQQLWLESRRAWEKYEMLLLPGLEVTNDARKYHILGIDIKSRIDPDLSVGDIVTSILEQGGIAVACHPHKRNGIDQQPSRYLWDNHERFSKVFDAWEVANRDDLFNVVGLKKFRYIANSDFHSEWHIYSWKTLLMCEKNPEAIKAAIRDNNKVAIYLLRQEKPAA